MRLASPLKWHGGKHYLAPKLWEIAKATPHIHRVEVFGGSLAFTLATEPEGYSEVVNDLHGELTNFWKMLKSVDYFHLLQRSLETTPFSEHEWKKAQKRQANTLGRPCWERAADFLVLCRQSLAGRMDAFAPLSRTRTRRDMNEQASAWLNAVEGLPAVHARLKRVVVLDGQDFAKVLHSQDGEQTLFYCDPPYSHETRASTGEYAHEMTKEDHARLLNALSNLQGKFMLSGYRNHEYDVFADAHGWKRRDFDLPNNAAGGDSKRRMIECVWCNFE